MQSMFTAVVSAALSVALSVPVAVARPTKPAEIPARVDPGQAEEALQVAEAAIRAGRYDEALVALNRAAVSDPNQGAIYLRRSGVLERLAGPAATWAQLRAASPSPQFRGVAEQLFYAAADAELYLRLAPADAPNRARIEARIADLRDRQRRAEELTRAAAPAAPPPLVVASPVPPPTTTPPLPVTPVNTPAPTPAPVPVPVPSPTRAADQSPVEVVAPDSEASADMVEPGPVAAPEPTEPVAAPQAAVPQARCEEPSRAGLGLRIGGAAATSLGVGMAGVGVAGFVLGRRAEAEYESSPDVDARERADARGHAMNTMSIVGLVSAVALIGAGATLLGIDAARRRKLRAGAAVSSTGWGVVLQGRF